MRPTCQLDLPSGTLCYYEKNKRFQATCRNVFHGSSCKLTRYATRKAQLGGQPVAFMVQWLEIGPICSEDARGHKSQDTLDMIECDVGRQHEIIAELNLSQPGRDMLSYQVGGENHIDHALAV